MKPEIIRKIIHIFSVLIPIGYMFISRNIFTMILFSLTLIAILIEISRFKIKFIESYFLKIFGKLLRSYEVHGITGATWLFLGAALSVILFSYPVTLMILFLLTLCDAGASIIGENFGNIKLGSKTLEGSLAFLILGVTSVMWIPKMGLTEKIIGVLIGTFLEALKTPVDDNILVPLGTGMVVELVRKISL